MLTPSDITLVEGAIHNPEDPRHFMQVLSIPSPLQARVAGVVVASSTRTLEVSEVGCKVYPPVIYFPKEDVREGFLIPSIKTTFCPLKGDTDYFHLKVANRFLENAAWAYNKAFPFAALLKGYIAFDGQGIKIIKM